MSFPDSTSSVGRYWEWDWLNRHHVFVELQKIKVADNVNNAWNVNVSSYQVRRRSLDMVVWFTVNLGKTRVERQVRVK